MTHWKLATAMWLFAACSSDSAANDALGSATPVERAPAVELAVVAAAPPHWTDQVPGRIVTDEAHIARVGSPLVGRVVAVNVELGQHVQAGDALVTITSGDLAELRRARDRANVDVDVAARNHARVTELVAQHAIPSKQLTAAEQELAEARVAVAAAEQRLASLHVAARGATTFTISAPRAGQVIEKDVMVGQQVSVEGGALVTIGDLSAVWAVADVLADATDGIAPGTRTEVTIDGLAVPRAGVVDRIGQLVDASRYTVPVRIRLDNHDGVLRPNAITQVRFFRERDNTLAVPASALLFDGANSYVYVMRDGTPRRQDVVPGPRNADIVSIRAGLAAGDRVVVHGASVLENQLRPSR